MFRHDATICVSSLIRRQSTPYEIPFLDGKDILIDFRRRKSWSIELTPNINRLAGPVEMPNRRPGSLNEGLRVKFES